MSLSSCNLEKTIDALEMKRAVEWCEDNLTHLHDSMPLNSLFETGPERVVAIQALWKDLRFALPWIDGSVHVCRIKGPQRMNSHKAR